MRFGGKCLFALFIAGSANAFSIVPANKNVALARSPLMSSMEDDFSPSDTSSDDFNDVVNVESEPYQPTETESLVTDVLDMIPSSLGEASQEERAEINEAIYKLEGLNPTKEPAMSPLINGVWELRYVGGYSMDWALPSPTRQLALFLYSGGYSPGIFALSLAQKLPSGLISADDLEIAISRDQPRVEAKVGLKLLGGSSSEISVKAKLDIESDIRLRETYESATVLGNAVNIPSQIKYSRDLFVTYLDDDILIVREASGIPEVLVRKEKAFTNEWGNEPGEVMDDEE